MGGGIAMNFVNAGIPVTLLEMKQEALDKGLGDHPQELREHGQEGQAHRGAGRASAWRCSRPTLDYDDLATPTS